jgi:hypothetical protein
MFFEDTFEPAVPALQVFYADYLTLANEPVIPKLPIRTN